MTGRPTAIHTQKCGGATEERNQNKPEGARSASRWPAHLGVLRLLNQAHDLGQRCVRSDLWWARYARVPVVFTEAPIPVS